MTINTDNWLPANMLVNESIKSYGLRMASENIDLKVEIERLKANTLQTFTVIKGKCTAPKSDSLYCVFDTRCPGHSLGLIIRGGACNWQSSGITGHIELPVQMDQADHQDFKRTGDLPGELTAN